MTDIILINYSFIESDICEVCTTLLLFLSIPVTVDTAERSFSKLKIIKSYLRNSMNQDRLSNLALLAIEHHAAENSNLKTYNGFC